MVQKLQAFDECLKPVEDVDLLYWNAVVAEYWICYYHIEELWRTVKNCWKGILCGI